MSTERRSERNAVAKRKFFSLRLNQQLEKKLTGLGVAMLESICVTATSVVSIAIALMLLGKVPQTRCILLESPSSEHCVIKIGRYYQLVCTRGPQCSRRFVNS